MKLALRTLDTRGRALALALALAATGGPGCGPDAAPATVVPAPPPAAATPSGASGFPYPIERRTLANGLEVLVVPMRSNGLVSYRTVVRTGARDEVEPGHTGFAHFFEHMMFRGTKKVPADLYNEHMTKIGADANAYTTSDMTVYELDIVAEDLDLVIELESDRFRNLEYGEPAFQTEAGAVYGEYRKNRADPEFVLYEATVRAAFERHTYAHTAMGYVEDIQAMPGMFDYSRSFFGRHYRPENCRVIVVGDVDPKAVFARVEAAYGTWEPGYVAPEVAVEPEQRAEKRLDLSYEGSTLPMVLVAYKGGAYDAGDRRWVASLVLAELAFGETSEIYRKLVLDERSVRSIGVEPATGRDPELWSIYAKVSEPAKVEQVLGEIDATVASFRGAPASEEAIERVKSHLRYSFLMRLDTPSRVADNLARVIGTTGSISAIDEFYDTLAQVTAQDVQDAATGYLVREHRTVAVLRSARDAGKGGER